MTFHFLCFCRYWNDPVVLSKLGQAMGVGVPGEGGLGMPEAANDEDDEEGDEEEDELTVHHTASTGDVEVWDSLS